jgi:branched-chain amino acid transport system permease protein
MSTQTSGAGIGGLAAGGAGVTLRRNALWLICLAIALVMPWLFFDFTTGRHSGFVVSMLSQMGLMIVLAMSFNMLMGQAGLLSFGHAVFFGFGGYCTAHALNAIKAETMWLPVELVPLVGGAGGLVFALVLGYPATKQRATAFAMITLAIGELVTACALMFKLFFGGEGGVSTDRMVDTSLFGFSYSQSIQVYYLVVAWTVIAVALMWLQTQTPLGRMANACRDNFERAQFVGYDPRRVRYWQFALSGFFAGIGGALYALVYEIVTFDTLAAPMSGNALLMAYIGGAGGFFGPVLGAILVVLLQSGVSLLSSAWLVYVGVLFIIMVMFAPGGMIGLIGAHKPIARIGRLRALMVPYARMLVPALLALLGFVLLVEFATFMTIGAAQGKKFKLFAGELDPATALPWVIAGGTLVLGGLWLRREARAFRVVWDGLMAEAKARGAVA